MIVSGVSDEKVDLSESAVLQRILKEAEQIRDKVLRGESRLCVFPCAT